MNGQEIIEMARQAGSEAAKYPSLIQKSEWETLERFAKLVAAKEREACAIEADKWSKRDDDVGAFIGKSIRARGEE